ncbi:dihydrodipicolinate synthase family protein [Cupriavidus basilensis]
MTTPQELKQIVSEGLLSFPVTDFDAQATSVPRPMSSASNGWPPTAPQPCSPPAASASSSADAGRLFQCDPHCRGNLCGQGADPGRCRRTYPHGHCLRQEAQRLGAKGILPLPHYLTEACQEGIANHIEEVCKSVHIGVIVYNCGNSRINAEMLERLADRCPNLIGFQGRRGRDREHGACIRRKLGDRLSYLGGLPTAEVYAAAYKALGVPVYLGRVQLHPQDSDGLLPRDCGRRPRHHQPPDRRSSSCPTWTSATAAQATR